MSRHAPGGQCARDLLERARRAADAAACFAAAAAATRNERERAFLIERVRSITPD